MQSTEDWHPSASELSDFAVGRLSSVRAAIVERHVRDCARCPTVLGKAPDDDFIGRLREAALAFPRAERESADHKAPDQPDHDQIPQVLRRHERYRVIRRLADGGMSAIYLGEHRLVRNLVVLKLPKCHGAPDGQSVERLLQEARTAGRLSHPNVARLLDAERLCDSVLLVSEYIHGGTLASLCGERGPLPCATVVELGIQVAVGLQHAFEAGVIHRDIKPANLMVESGTGTAKILDFGLGRFVQEAAAATRITNHSQVLGTPHYLAPEQAANARSADIQSDIYSLGCVLFYLLIGEPPFRGSALELIDKHESEAPRKVHHVRRDVPVAIGELIDSMLAKHPSSRPQIPWEVAETLARTRRSRADQHHERDSFTRIERFWHALLSPVVILPLITLLLICVLMLRLR